MIVLVYPDHLTVAIAPPQTKSGFVRYKTRLIIYAIQQPVNSAVVGENRGYENTPFEIIKEYN